MSVSWNGLGMKAGSSRPQVLGILAFSLASNAAVLFVIQFGLFIWPERLPVNSQNVFWLASGVNTAGLLLLGLRCWPILLLNSFPPWLLGLEPLGMCLVGASTNALEALLAAWIILRFGRFAGTFDQVRTIGALVTASIVAPLANTLIIPAYLSVQGIYPWSDYGRALGNWNLSNGAALLMLVPLLVGTIRHDWSPGVRMGERMILALFAAGLSFVAFDAVFKGTGMNFAFIAFPVVIYTAVRFGIGETAVVLGLALVAIYGSLVAHGRSLPPEQIVSVIWFVQAFSWVLAATGLFVAALGAERRFAEMRSLEASLREERARLDALRYQLNPHFLFNALNSIRAAMPISEEVPRAMITDLAGYLRSTLDHDETDRISLSEEVRSAQDYLAIEKRRFGDRLRLFVQIDADAGGVSVPVFLLQPLVENAIRHGLETSKNPCDLSIRAEVGPEGLQIEVANSGRWKEPVRPGIGLENIRRRLELIYGGAAQLTIAQGEHSVRVSIGLPLR